MTLGCLQHLALVVSDRAHSELFYDKVLGFLGYRQVESNQEFTLWWSARAGAISITSVEQPWAMASDPPVPSSGGLVDHGTSSSPTSAFPAGVYGVPPVEPSDLFGAFSTSDQAIQPELLRSIGNPNHEQHSEQFATIEDALQESTFAQTPRIYPISTTAQTGSPEDRLRKALGLYHVAFSAESQTQVDELHQILIDIGANILQPPAAYDHYAPGYYAVFFTDPDGIRMEVVHMPVLP